MYRSTLLLCVLAAVTFFAGLGRGAITDADEAFYAESAHEMVASGDWITPHYNFEPRFQKPVLYYWLAAFTYVIAGESETAARWWAAMAGLGLVLVTAACGRRWYDPATGLLAGAIVATNFGYFFIGRMALPDLPLTFCITLAIWAGLVATLDPHVSPRRWVLIAALALGLGCLMKGPVGLIIPALVAVPVLLIERRSLNLGARNIALGTLVVVAVAAPWYLAMWVRHGDAYLQGFFVGDNLERFATDRFNDPRAWWFYLPVVAGGLLPWTPLALVWLRPLGQFLRGRLAVGTVGVRLLLWALVPLAFYTASIGKQPRYVLPVLPPLAVLLASSIMERTRDWRGLDGARTPARRSTLLVVGAVTSGGLLVILATLLYRVQPLLINVTRAYTLAAVAVVAASGLAVAGTALSRAWRRVPVVLAIGSALVFAALQYGGLSSGGDDTVQQMAGLVARHRTGGEPVAAYGVFGRNLVFYTGVQQVNLFTDEQAQQFLMQPGRVLVVAPAATIDRLERERGLTLRRIAELPYFNEAGIRMRTLLWPDPRRDLQQVVLASNR